MRLTAALWALKHDFAGKKISRKINVSDVQKMINLSDQQWRVFLQTSHRVLVKYTGLKYSDLDPRKRNSAIKQIRERSVKEGLPVLDDRTIDWRMAKCMPLLVRTQRIRDFQKLVVEQCDDDPTKQRAKPTKFLNSLIRSALYKYIDKKSMRNLSAYSDIPDIEREQIIHEVKNRLVANNLPIVDEKAIVLLLQKIVWHDLKQSNKTGRDNGARLDTAIEDTEVPSPVKERGTATAPQSTKSVEGKERKG